MSLLIITSPGKPTKHERSRIPLSHANLFKANALACFKHPNFFKVNDPEPPPTQLGAEGDVLEVRGGHFGTDLPERPRAPAPQISTTSFLTATTLIYAIGAGITAAAGTRLALQLFLAKLFKLCSFRLQVPVKGPASLFIVTTSPYWDWVICAPAAFLGSGSHLSGSLSGTEP